MHNIMAQTAHTGTKQKITDFNADKGRLQLKHNINNNISRSEDGVVDIKKTEGRGEDGVVLWCFTLVKMWSALPVIHHCLSSP